MAAAGIRFISGNRFKFHAHCGQNAYADVPLRGPNPRKALLKFTFRATLGLFSISPTKASHRA